jgi:hypothetical protein
MDPTDTSNNAWKRPGDLNRMFERIVTDPAYQAYQPKVLSRPSYADGDTPETADYKIGLWMVQFDTAVTDEEADRLVELGATEGYERSSDVGEEQPDGTFTAYVNEKRTSTNSVRLSVFLWFCCCRSCLSRRSAHVLRCGSLWYLPILLPVVRRGLLQRPGREASHRAYR